MTELHLDQLLRHPLAQQLVRVRVPQGAAWTRFESPSFERSRRLM